MNNIYFDNAATTPVRQEVYERMLPFYRDNYGNPSSIYEIARGNKKAVDRARAQIARAINAETDEIYFTGSGTEADNWAIKGIAEATANKGKHIITTAIEHHAVLHTCEYLGKKGYEVTFLPVDEYGIVRLEELKKAVRDDTVLITVMHANNEIGTLQPIKEIGAFARERGITFHTDAIQSLGHVPIDVKDLNVDLMSLSAHKVNGPKGVGCLYIKKGIKIPALIHGGAQERGRRAGTENVAGIIGFGEAAEISLSEMENEMPRVKALREKLIDGVLSTIPHCRLNGHRDLRLPGNANISFEFIEGESILLLLDMNGIYASSGSACTSGSLDPSHVLLSIGLPHEKAHGSLRLSLDRYNTAEEVEAFIDTLAPIISRLREMSPLYEDFIKKRT